MAEPNTGAIAGGALGLGALLSLLGPTIGPWVLLIVGAVIGAAMKAGDTDAGFWGGLAAFGRGVGVALVLTTALALMLAPLLGVAADVLLAPVALMLAWQYQLIPVVLRRGLDRILPSRKAKGADHDTV